MTAAVEFPDVVGLDTDDRALGVVGGTMFGLLVVYIVLNRAIPDIMVLPIGISIRPHEIVLMLAIAAWVVWILIEPRPFPAGLVGLVGLATVTVLVLAPFLNGPGLSTYEANGAERGVFRVLIFACLFIMSYHIGRRPVWGKRLLGVLIAATFMQGALGVWEYLTATPVNFMYDFARSLGLIVDPNGLRGELTSLLFRTEVAQAPSGLLRAQSTAPHPIVLSSGVALALLVCVAWLVFAERTRTKVWLAIATFGLTVMLPVANSRTAFFILAVAIPPLAILLIRSLPRLIPWTLIAVAAFAVAFAVSPNTPRLLLNTLTRSEQDPNTQVRLERFSLVPDLMADRPIVGAGYLTHDPAIQIFDNAYNLGLIEFGILGFVLTIWWFLIVLVRTWSAVDRSPPSIRILPVAGVIAVLSLLAASFTFDALTFDQFFPTTVIMMALGCGTADLVIRDWWARSSRAIGHTAPSQ